MGPFDRLNPEMMLSRRYSAAQAWVSNKADPETQTNPFSDAVVGDRPFVDILETAHQAVGRIWAGADTLPSPADLMERAETAVAALEGACAALGYKRSF